MLSAKRKLPTRKSRRSMTHLETSKDNQYDDRSRCEGAIACPG